MPKGNKIFMHSDKNIIFPCTSCDYTSTSELGLKLHYRKSHNINSRLKNIKDCAYCRICGQFPSAFGLRKHILLKHKMC